MKKTRDKTRNLYIEKKGNSILRNFGLLIPMIVILSTFTGCMGIIYQAARVATIAVKLAASTPTPPADPDVHKAGSIKLGLTLMLDYIM